MKSLNTSVYYVGIVEIIYLIKIVEIAEKHLSSLI